MNHLEDISPNVDYVPKMGKFGQKRDQNGRGKIFPEPVTSILQKKTIK